MDVLMGADFFTVEVLSWRGLVTYYVLFFIHLGSRRVRVAGITRHPDQEWMEQIARSATQETWGLSSCCYILHDRDTKFCASFRSILAGSGVKTLALPARSPNLNAFAERWVRSAKEECLSKLILFGEGPCRGLWPNSAPIITVKETIRGKVTSCCSQRLAMSSNNVTKLLRVAAGSEVYSSTMAASHEFFDLTASRQKSIRAPGEQFASLPRLGALHHRYSWTKAA